MNRYELIKDLFFHELSQKCFGTKLDEAHIHLIQTSTMAILIGKKENQDIEMCAIAGLLHDSSTYLNNNSFNHAQLSSQYTRKLMEKSKLFSEEEIELIATAIENHSHKKRVDDPFSEIIKASDVASQYLMNGCNLVSRKHERHLEYLIETKIIDSY